MTKTPRTREELTAEVARLRRQVAGLKAHEAARRRTEEKLRESEAKYKTITDAATAAIVMIDDRGVVTFWNPAAERIFGYSVEEAVGKELHILMAPEKYHVQYHRGFKRFSSSGKGKYIDRMAELTAVRKDGTEFPIGLSLSAIKIKGKWHSIGIVRDITKRKRNEAALRKARDELERRVAQRTAELVEANKELEQRALELAEANTALKVLLKQSGTAKSEVEDKMMSTIQELVAPHLDRLQKRLVRREEQVFVNIIRSNLEQITSSFSRRLTVRARNLTPREIQVADFIRNGQTTKEISELLNVSPTTVETYRANLRKKLMIANRKVNLRSYLNSLQTD